MTEKESQILDDLHAWRDCYCPKAGRNLISIPGNRDLPIIKIEDGDLEFWRQNSTHDRLFVEPEMRDALEKVQIAISSLESAKNAIIERKLYELRIAGMRGPGKT